MANSRIPKHSKSTLNIICLFAFSVVNLLFMHYSFLANGHMELELYMFALPVNLFAVILDVATVLLICTVLSCGRLKYSLFLTFIITLLWSFTNVCYGRFFNQYLSISAMTQASSLADRLVIHCILDSLMPIDLLYPIWLAVFVYIYHKIKIGRLKMQRIISAIGLVITGALVGIFTTYTSYHLLNPRIRWNAKLYLIQIDKLLCHIGNEVNTYSNNTNFYIGSVRILCSNIIDVCERHELTAEQRKLIEEEYSDMTYRDSVHERPCRISNVNVILLESFLSSVSDLFVDGKEITPFLNSLKRDSIAYYNGKLKSNITIGSSGDGQFIYMTGLLPLKDKITVGEAKGHKIPALPCLLKEHFGVEYTEIIIPTTEKMWGQSAMNSVYGIDNVYQSTNVISDSHGCLNDEQVFSLASTTPKETHQPFFSMTLSFSTHLPYRNPVVSNFSLKDSSIPEAYRNYLIACHYADEQLQRYISYLKESGLYDNSLIIIVSDHNALLDALGMTGRLSADIPLYILNGDIDNDKAWHGECNQLDVFTTILDILDIQSDWRGLGHTLLSSDYQNSVTNEIWEISRWIILGDYFSNIKKAAKSGRRLR